MNHSNHDSKMMWLMMAGCLLLPLALIFFGGRSGGIGSNWGWFAFIGAFILIHIVMMFGGHGHGESEEDTESIKPPETPAKPQVHEHH